MIRAYLWFWWGLWVVMGKLIRLSNRIDTWVRRHYADTLTQEFKQRHPEHVGPSVDH